MFDLLDLPFAMHRWVDEEDADGDGYSGDIVEVRWDNGHVGDYRTGFEGEFRLCLDPDSMRGQGNRMETGEVGRGLVLAP